MSTATTDDTDFLVEQSRALRQRVEADRAACLRTAHELADDDTPHGRGECEYALQRYEELGERLAVLPDIKPPKESGPYARGSGVSFFRDLAAAAGAPVRGASQHEAQERLLRHADGQQSRMELARREAELKLGYMGITARGASEVSERALSVATDPGAVPPRWLNEAFSSVARAAAPLAKLVTTTDLPPDTMQIHVPRLTSAAGVVPLQQENTNAPQSPDQSDEFTSNIATFAGDTSLSLQLFERSPHFGDMVIVKDFAENYAASLQSQMINGTGLNGQLLGLLNVTAVDGIPGPRTVTWTAGSPAPWELNAKIAECAAQISDTRDRSPSCILMRGARYFWMVGQKDGNSEPVQRPGTGLPPEDESGPYGPVVGLPVYHDNTIGTEAGVGKNQDAAVILTRAADHILLSDPLGPRFSAFTETNAAGQLTVCLQWHTFTGFLSSRYPSGIGYVTGTGLASQSGY